MKTVSVNKRARTINALLDQALDEDILIETEDGTRFVLSAVDDFAQEIEAQRRNKKLMAFLDERAKATEWIPLEEVERKLGLDRKKPDKGHRQRKPARK